MANNAIGAKPVSAVVGPSPNRTSTCQRNKNKSCAPMKNAAVCAGWSAPLASRASRSTPGPKKAARLPPLSATLLPVEPTAPPPYYGHLCRKKPTNVGLVPHDTPSRRLLHRRAQCGSLSTTVGAPPSGLSRGTLLHELVWEA